MPTRKPRVRLVLINYRRPSDGQVQAEWTMWLPSSAESIRDGRRFGAQCVLAGKCTDYIIQVSDE